VCWIHFVSVAGSCEHGTEPSGSIKGGEFLDHLSGFLSLMKDLLQGINLSWKTKFEIIFVFYHQP
jgi:hypothetical protein